MSLAQQLLLKVPVLPLGLLISLVAGLSALVFLVLVWRFAPREIWKRHNDVTNAIFQAIAMAYTVLLAFVVVISWQNYDKARDHIEREANSLVDLYVNAGGLAPAFQDSFDTLIRDYVNRVIDEEWKLLARSQESVKAREALAKLWDLYRSYEPVTEKEKAFFADSIVRLTDVREARRLRIVDSKSSVHPLLWFLLIIGGILTMGFSLILGADSFHLHLLMTSLLAIFIALILFMILMFDYPFTGSFGIGPDAYRRVLGI